MKMTPLPTVISTTKPLGHILLKINVFAFN